MIAVKYVGIQMAAYAIDVGVFLLIMQLGFAGPIISNVTAKIAAGIFAFFCHRHYTFQATGGNANSQAVRYFVLLFANIPVSSGLLALLLYVINEPIVAKIIADVIGVAITYLISKHFVFSTKKTSTNKVSS